MPLLRHHLTQIIGYRWLAIGLVYNLLLCQVCVIFCALICPHHFDSFLRYANTCLMIFSLSAKMTYCKNRADKLIIKATKKKSAHYKFEKIKTKLNKIRRSQSYFMKRCQTREKTKNIAIAAIQQKFPNNDGSKVEFYYTNFGDSAIDFLLRFWVDAKENKTALEVKSEAIIAIKTAFDEHKINIPFPITTLIQQS
ncbi:MAG: mechanosensitive ion channel [Chitinophagales bacterium]|nr:mechanosensitive ion channel [Chitinophagales bacterium]